MDSAKNQLIDKLKSSSNVLVTVSRNPTVDQLAALLGLSLVLNKQGKHCAAVFSGEVPSIIDFLKPEESIEKTTDSLRDFIIALDKNKADKLRYKVEDNIVRIFITPYKTSITEKDLEFSQGDFNVDLLVALGVKEQAELDEAITAHGRILHDAVVASINLNGKGDLGTINWVDSGASSLCEAVTEISQALNDKVIDNQIATALLTGIVAETDRFRNEKTTPQTMSISSVLMQAGANQQLIATKIDSTGSNVDKPETKSPDNTTLEISHDQAGSGSTPSPIPESEHQEPELDTSKLSPGPKLVSEPPQLGGALTANTQQNITEPSTDPLSVPTKEEDQILEHKAQDVEPISTSKATQEFTSKQKLATSLDNYTPPPVDWHPPEVTDDKEKMPQLNIDAEGTLSQLEEAVHSPHLSQTGVEDKARDAVNQAIATTPDEPSAPIKALNAQPLGEELHPDGPDFKLPEVDNSLNNDQEDHPSAAPPVPPPIPPSVYNPPSSQ